MNLGYQEIIVILIIALIVFGPKKLPEIGRQVGNALREFKKMSGDVQRAFDLDEYGSSHSHSDYDRNYYNSSYQNDSGEGHRANAVEDGRHQEDETPYDALTDSEDGGGAVEDVVQDQPKTTPKSDAEEPAGATTVTKEQTFAYSAPKQGTPMAQTTPIRGATETTAQNAIDDADHSDGTKSKEKSTEPLTAEDAVTRPQEQAVPSTAAH